MKVSPEIQNLVPYQPGKPISETKRELGLTEVIKLASNESPLGPSPKVMAVLKEALNEINLYPDGACFEMREAMAQHLGVDSKEIAFGNGSDELVDRLVQIYVEPGDAVLTSQGAFSAYEISTRSCRGRILHTPLTKDFRFDLPAMLPILEKESRLRLVFLANPNNPTGTYFAQKEFDAFMAVASKKDIFVVLDEAYTEFVRAKDYPDGLRERKRYKNLLSIRTMSKVYGLAGLRVGTLIAPPEVCDLVNRIRKPFNINSLAQAAVVAALQDRDHVEKIKKLTWEGLDYYYEQLTQMGLKFLPSEGNFVLFDTGREAESVYQGLLREGIILRPVKGYGFPNHLRMSVGLPEQNRAAIAALKKVLAR